MSDILIAAANVRMVYGHGAATVCALNNVSLDVYGGEVLAIFGPSGSGKTTLLQILGTLIRPTSGSVSVGGISTDGLSRQALGRLRLQSFGFVFQAHHLIPTLNAWENVAVALDLRGVRGAAAERRSCALLDEVGLSSRAEAFPAQMSGGEKQRVAIARALGFDPAVILADEPTASLDTASGWRVAGLLSDLARRHGRGVVIVTHDTRLLGFADRAVEIEDGRIITPGTPHP
jgi:putative ABC transport system ATP-binding protein